MTEKLLRAKNLCFALALCMSMAASSAAQDTFDRRALLQSLVDHALMPGQTAFIAAADDMLLQTAAFLAKPDRDKLVALQSSWRDASDAWEEIAMWTFDLRITALHNQIDKTPLNIDFAEDFLASDAPIDEKTVDGLGSTTRGLPAIEYLIFSPEKSADEIISSLSDSRRRDYLLALAQNIAGKARALRDNWSPQGRDYAARFVNADHAAGKIQGSINMLANKVFEVLETNLQMWLGEPSGIALGSEPQPELVESPRSRHSLAHIKHTLLGLRRIFTGGADADALGFDDYLDYFGAEAADMPLSELISVRFDDAQAAIDAIETPLSIAVIEEAPAVAHLYEALRQLLIPLRVDMKSQLGIVLTFSDRDGDQ